VSCAGSVSIRCRHRFRKLDMMRGRVCYDDAGYSRMLHLGSMADADPETDLMHDADPVASF